MATIPDEVLQQTKQETVIIDMARDGLKSTAEYDKEAGQVDAAQYVIDTLTEMKFPNPTVWLRHVFDVKKTMAAWRVLPMSHQRYYVNRALITFLAEFDEAGQSTLEIRATLISDGDYESWKRLVRNNFCMFMKEIEEHLK